MINDWIDISVPLHTGMAHWPDNPPVQVEYMLHMERGDTCTVSKLSMGSHTGTHMDGPFHFLLEGKGLDEMPLDAAIGRARVIEIRDPESIEPDELRPHNIRQGDACFSRRRILPGVGRPIRSSRISSISRRKQHATLHQLGFRRWVSIISRLVGTQRMGSRPTRRCSRRVSGSLRT